MSKRWLLDWLEAEAAGPAVAGGKGWNLARLYRYGFPVPRGGVLTAGAYARFMSEPTLHKLQQALSKVSADAAASTKNARRFEEMQAAIRSTPLPQEIGEQVEEFLSRHALERVPVAVRSSATTEDSAAASFAGIHASRLGQVGLEAVVDSIRECYASLWSPRAVAYRRRLNLNDEDVSCAVVLCRMVGAGGDPAREPEAAGVAFSCDPRSGRRDIVTIGAVRGLGEAVVSGGTTPAEILVEAGWRPSVLERRNNAHEEVLSDDLAIRLAHLVQRVEWALGDGQQPQDIEWAFDGSTFWLLQARPVTSLPRYTFSGAERLPVVWSNANLKDALPGVLSPLGWSIALAVVRRNLFAPHRAAGYEIPAGLEICRRFSGRAYFDFTSLFWAFYDGLGISAREFNRSLGGHQPELPVDEPDPMKGSDARRRRRARTRLLRTIYKVDKALPQEIRAQFETARSYRGVDLTKESLEQLRHRLMDLTERSQRFGPLSMLANISAGLWHDMLERLLAKVAPAEAHALASDLVAGSGRVVSAEHGYRLLDLAAIATRDAEAQVLLNAQPLEPSAWRRLPATSPFRTELERFLAEFGHRGVYEVDIANPRWIEDPTYILQQVRLLLDAGVSTSFRDAGKRRRQKALGALRRRAWFLSPLIRWIARRASNAAALREASKSALVALLEPSRYIILEVARRMHAAGILAEREDIFYLTLVDLDAYLRGWWDGSGAMALVHDRKAQKKVWLAEEPPDVIVESADGLPHERVEEALLVPHATAQAGAQIAPPVSPERPAQTLRGTPVAAGTATGRVRILRHPSEGDRLGAGEILVAPSTDPGWTPLFMRAAAVVMEVGGYHSHGAIVAREFGIPAVANIPNLLTLLKDGETITVQGDTGTIVRH